ncbi:hypothetical protein Tco_0784153, partial [Tanacetum coccineum]
MALETFPWHWKRFPGIGNVSLALETFPMP